MVLLLVADVEDPSAVAVRRSVDDDVEILVAEEGLGVITEAEVEFRSLQDFRVEPVVVVGDQAVGDFVKSCGRLVLGNYADGDE
jgi:hypothetical protein